MRSTSPALLAHRAMSRLTLSVALLAAACDVGTTPPPTDPDPNRVPMKELNEVTGTVQRVSSEPYLPAPSKNASTFTCPRSAFPSGVSLILQVLALSVVVE